MNITDEQLQTVETFMSALSDTASAAAEKNKNQGYAFQYGYSVTAIVRLLGELNLNKRQLKMVRNETARLNSWGEDYKKGELA